MCASVPCGESPAPLLLDPRPLLQPLPIGGGIGNKTSPGSSRDRRPDRVRGPAVDLNVAVRKMDVRSSRMVGPGQVVPHHLLVGIHEETIVDRVRVFLDEGESLRRAGDLRQL